MTPSSPAKTPERGVKRTASSSISPTMTPSPKATKRAKNTMEKDETPKANACQFRDNDILHYTGAKSASDYLTRRCKRADGRSVEKLLGGFTYTDGNGETRKYGKPDLSYDIKGGRLRVET